MCFTVSSRKKRLHDGIRLQDLGNIKEHISFCLIKVVGISKYSGRGSGSIKNQNSSHANQEIENVRQYNVQILFHRSRQLYVVWTMWGKPALCVYFLRSMVPLMTSNIRHIFFYISIPSKIHPLHQLQLIIFWCWVKLPVDLNTSSMIHSFKISP